MSHTPITNTYFSSLEWNSGQPLTPITGNELTPLPTTYLHIDSNVGSIDGIKLTIYRETSQEGDMEAIYYGEHQISKQHSFTIPVPFALETEITNPSYQFYLVGWYKNLFNQDTFAGEAHGSLNELFHHPIQLNI